VCKVITHFLSIILIKCVCESNQDEIRPNAFNIVYGSQAVISMCKYCSKF
jgi:hypothetical protein